MSTTYNHASGDAGGSIHASQGGGDVSNGGGDGSSSLYELCARVPLIKSPGVRVPPPVTLSSGSLHPLPPNLQEYFVYPFSLERFVLDAADRRERARREDLQRRAPGWNEGAAGVLQPTSRHSATTAPLDDAGPSHQQQPTNEIDEIAQMLDRLDKS